MALIQRIMLVVFMVSSFGPTRDARDGEEPDGHEVGPEQAACAALAGDAAQAAIGAEARALQTCRPVHDPHHTSHPCVGIVKRNRLHYSPHIALVSAAP